MTYPAEGQILLWIQENLRFPALDGVMCFVTTLGNGGAFWIALAVALLLFRRTRRCGVLCAAALLMGYLTTNIALKNIIHRIRPYEVIDTLKILVHPESSFSFPSGHSTSSLAAGWVLFRSAKKRFGVPALILGVWIALSRMYVGVHYPTDVLAGSAIGVLAAEAALLLSRKWRPFGRLTGDVK